MNEGCKRKNWSHRRLSDQDNNKSASATGLAPSSIDSLTSKPTSNDVTPKTSSTVASSSIPLQKK